MRNPEPSDPGPQEHSDKNQTDHTEHNPNIRFCKCEDARVPGSFGGGISGVAVRDEVRMRGLVGNLRLNQEAVALPRDGLDVERLVGGIAQRLAKLVNGRIDVKYVRVFSMVTKKFIDRFQEIIWMH